METFIPIIISLVEKAVTQFPALKQDLKDILHKADATPEDWEALRQRNAKSYGELVPHSSLPPEETR